jgi:hypothetical protein
MTDRGAGCMGKPLVRFCEGQGYNHDMDEIRWHRRESRRQQRKQTSSCSQWESPVYSKVRDWRGLSVLVHVLVHAYLFLSISSREQQNAMAGHCQPTCYIHNGLERWDSTAIVMQCIIPEST